MSSRYNILYEQYFKIRISNSETTFAILNL